MQKLIVLALMLATSIAFTVTRAGDKTYYGKLVDSKCYSMMPKMNAENDHMVKGEDGKPMQVKACAAACASMGIPVALLGENGKMFVLALPAGQLSQVMAKNAKITGSEMNGVLIVDKVEVQNGKKWEEVKISYMM